MTGEKFSEKHVAKLEAIRAKINESKDEMISTLNEFDWPQSNGTGDNAQPKWSFVESIFFILIRMVEQADASNEPLLTSKDSQKFHTALQKAIAFGCSSNLSNNSLVEEQTKLRVTSVVLMLRKITASSLFLMSCTRREQKLVHKELIKGLLHLLAFVDDAAVKLKAEAILQNITSTMKLSQLFEILFLVKGDAQLPMQIQTLAHKQLLLALYRTGSFVALCESLLPPEDSTDAESDEEIRRKRQQCCIVVSTIVGRRGYAKQFYYQMVDEIIEHLQVSGENERQNKRQFIDAAVECLTRLFALELNFVRNKIAQKVLTPFERISSPTDLLTGSIVLDQSEIMKVVHVAHAVFCLAGPSHTTLPSYWLINYLPLLIQLDDWLSALPEQQTRRQLIAVIVKCLSNRDIEELNQLTENILFENETGELMRAHARIELHSENNNFDLRIRNAVENVEQFDFESLQRSSVRFVNLLKQSNHNVLIFNVFLHLLRLLSTNFDATKTSSEFISNEDELTVAIKVHFQRKFSLLYALNELIMFTDFHGQFKENPRQLCDVLDQILNRQIERSSETHFDSENQNILLVILSIVDDLMKLIQNEELKQRLTRTLRRLEESLTNAVGTNEVCHKIRIILSPEKIPENSDFSKAMKLLNDETVEPYMKVYALMTLLKLIEAHDGETLMHRHTVLATTMKLLRANDSYIFLNCIKLLTTLTYVLSDAVLDGLIAEYHLNIDASTIEVDYKLKIGETIVKVVTNLGDMSFKFKDILINCFLRGCTHSNDEFRTSNISNLGNILRILCYQIHTFFQEVSEIMFAIVNPQK